MTKSEVINNIASTTKLPKSSCESVIDAFADEVKDCLIKGDKLIIKGFMSFEVKQNEERKGRNPQTNEIVTFPASKSVRCQISKLIKDAINEQ